MTKIPDRSGRRNGIGEVRDGGESFIMYSDKNGIVYPEPYPSKEDLKRVYSGIAYHVLRQFEVGHKPYAERFDHDFAIGKGRISKLLEVFPNCDSVIDVGCSNGALVSEAIVEGLDAFGCDINAEILDAAVSIDENLRGRLFVCDIESDLSAEIPEVGDGNFRVIIMNDVIEHLLNPMRALKNAERMLGQKPGGIVIDTPDTGSDGFHRKGVEWHHVRPIEHPMLYNEMNMREIIRKTIPKSVVTRIDRPIEGKMVLYVEIRPKESRGK